MPAADPVLSRREIMRAFRIRKLLYQASRETGPSAAAFAERARAMAAAYPRGPRLVYEGKPVLR